MTTYGGGLRVSEVVRLRVSDIDAGRGMLRVEQGKGRKDRYTLLGPRLLAELRRYWQLYRPTAPWLFPKQTKPEPMPIVTAQRMYYAAKERAGITKAGGYSCLAPRVYDPLIWKAARIWQPSSPPPFEVADIVRTYGAAFRATHAVSHEQARVLRAIAQYRTAALGGHVEHCVSWGTKRVCYDSCRNRHCPKCQGSARAK